MAQPIGTRRGPSLTELTRGVAEYGAFAGPCVEEPQVFFAHHDNVKARQRAREICQGCPFRLPCLNLAVERKEKYGIWGGTTRHERDALRRKLRLGVATPAVEAA